VTEIEGKKVELHRLLFTMSWEDPALDRAAFRLRPGARVATVCSGACNTFAFLLDDPSYLLAFDYNPTQVWVLELKAACFRQLEHRDMLALLGVLPSDGRQRLLDAVLPAVSDEAKEYWKQQAWLVRDGLLKGGRYERFVGLFGAFLRMIQGGRRIEGLFEERDRDERALFYARDWDNWRWRLLFRVFFNKTVMTRRGLTPDYFHFDDGSRSFAESFARRTKQAITELPVHDNYFLAQYVCGRYLREDRVPEYLRPENFESIRQRLDRLEMTVADVRDVFDGSPPGTFDAICLTNVFELMSEEDMGKVLPGVARVLKPGGRMTLRNLMVPRSVPPKLADVLVHDTDCSRELHRRDRSFAYRSFQVYTKRE
jgi:S-adenosylmethionine-diacylglycerol 3-amino-3-carboxypropyl transferase